MRLLGGQNAQQQVELEVALDVVQLLADGLDRDPLGAQLDEDRVVEIDQGDAARGPVKRGAEEHALADAGRGQVGGDPAQVGQEAHVEQPVGLVDDQDIEGLRAQGPFLDQVEKAAGRADGDVDALAEQLLLPFVADAAEDGRRREAEVLAQQAGLAFDLDGQLAGRGDDQGPAPLAFGAQQALEDGDQESGRLAGSRLGLHGGVAAAQGYGQRLFLDVGRVGVAPVRDGLPQPRMKAHFVKSHRDSLLRISTRGRAAARGKVTDVFNPVLREDYTPVKPAMQAVSCSRRILSAGSIAGRPSKHEAQAGRESQR